VTKEKAKMEIVRYWWSRAQESLEAAKRELAAGSAIFAMNRAYYALFYAVSALLLEEGHQFKKHSGVRAAFNREIVKSGRMEKKHGDLYNEIFDDRQEGDYIEFTKFDTEYVQQKIDGCEKFLVDLRPLLKSLSLDDGEGQANGQS
jgi:uncharacterized protein (UPF0332 family)